MVLTSIVISSISAFGYLSGLQSEAQKGFIRWHIAWVRHTLLDIAGLFARGVWLKGAFERNSIPFDRVLQSMERPHTREGSPDQSACRTSFSRIEGCIN